MIIPPNLSPGDLVYISAPAKAIEESNVRTAQHTLESWGLRVQIAEHCLGRSHYFSGPDEARRADLQQGIDSPEVKAILCARGGYGCIRLVESLNWTPMIKHPKWLIGFSDVTVFHEKLSRLGIASIHGIMPLGFNEGSVEAIETLKHALFGAPYFISGPTCKENINGQASGELIGGNLAIVCSLLGTPLSYDFKDKILFLEDVGEHIYKIDRMLYALKLNGVFQQIRGLILGGFTEMEDTDVPFGKSIKQLVLEQTQALGIPIAFDFPAGHIQDNRALMFGRSVTLRVTEAQSTLHYLK